MEVLFGCFIQVISLNRSSFRSSFSNSWMNGREPGDSFCAEDLLLKSCCNICHQLLIADPQGGYCSLDVCASCSSIIDHLTNIILVVFVESDAFAKFLDEKLLQIAWLDNWAISKIGNNAFVISQETLFMVFEDDLMYIIEEKSLCLSEVHSLKMLCGFICKRLMITDILAPAPAMTTNLNSQGFFFGRGIIN